MTLRSGLSDPVIGDVDLSTQNTGDRIERSLAVNMLCAFTERNEVTILRNGIEIFASMLEAIDSASSTIDFLTFVYWQGDVAQSFADALSRASKRGVAVRVVIDGYGGKRMKSSLEDQMKSAGCSFAWFRPLKATTMMRNNHRTHRKLLIVDSEIGFTGGVGIADEWAGDARNPNEWRDTHFKFAGPIVEQIHAGFRDNWLEATSGLPDRASTLSPTASAAGSVRATVISSPSQRFQNRLHTHFLVMFKEARSTVDLCTAYFMPDDIMIEAMKEASAREVRIRVLIPGPHLDKKIVNIAAREKLEELAEAGIDIRLYQPTMLHAKILVVDSVVASIGSANFNRRSTSSDEELNVVMNDNQTAELLTKQFEDDWSHGVGLSDSEISDLTALEDVLLRVTKPVRDLM